MGRPTKAQQAIIAERRTDTLRLRAEGKSVTEIARIQDRDPKRVSEDISSALAIRRTELGEPADDVRELELVRLDALYDAVWQVLVTKHLHVSNAGKVVEVVNEQTGEKTRLIDDGPTLAAVDRLVRIGESRRKLLGLDAPQKVETSGSVRYTLEGVDLEALS